MAFKTKTLSDLIRSTENALSVRFYGETTVLRKGVLKTLAAVVGGALFIMELLAARIWKDRFVSTCSVDCLDAFGTRRLSMPAERRRFPSSADFPGRRFRAGRFSAIPFPERNTRSRRMFR